MNKPANLFSIVIASLCDDARSELLKRACDSIRAMAGDYDYSIVVVANGPQVSASVLDWLAERPDTRVIQLRTGSHPLARRVGAEIADSEFLAFLDDDDELMPDTLAPKIEYFRQHPEVDVLVTDGLRISESSNERIFPPPEARSADFIETLMSSGWGAGPLTFRAQEINLAVFDTELRHIEWTLTTLTLARHHEFGFIDEPMYRYYEDTPNSLSKSAEHRLAAPEVWRRLSEVYAGTGYATAVRRRYGAVAHNASWTHCQRGNVRNAWRFHYESLRSPGGSAYLTFSAKLLLASFWQLISSGSGPAQTRQSPDC